jgi:copper chaperone CopZ
VRVPLVVVPVLVLLAATIGVGAARFLVVPSFEKEYPGGRSGKVDVAVFVVEGLKCVDTAETLANQLDELKGVRHFVAYASRNRAEVTYDPALTGPEAIRKAFQGPVYDQATETYLYRQYRVVEMNGAELR